MNDDQMVDDWHVIKSVLLKEMRLSATLDHMRQCADALFVARLMIEQITRECTMTIPAGDARDVRDT